MRKPADLISGAKKAAAPSKPAAEDPFVGTPSIPAADITGTYALGVLAVERAEENRLAYNQRVARQKSKEVAEEAKWQEILARRKLHGQMV